MLTATPSSEDVRVYECAILYPHPFSQKEEQTLLKEIEEHFNEAGGKLLFKDVWGRRGLAYKIGGFNESNVVIYYYELAPEKLKEVETALKIQKGVLRHLVIKPPKDYHIVSYANAFEEWKERQSKEEEVRKQEQEEKLKHQVLEKAKRQAKAAPRKTEPTDKPVMSGETLTKEIDKLISDTDLQI